jgi:hypothetical protein
MANQGRAGKVVERDAARLRQLRAALSNPRHWLHGLARALMQMLDVAMSALRSSVQLKACRHVESPSSRSTATTTISQ